jgi:transcriptional regulator with XRE-family HTH domain
VTALTTYDFGQFFKTARSELGVTQEDFGLLVGLAQSRVCKIENGALRLAILRTSLAWHPNSVCPLTCSVSSLTWLPSKGTTTSRR